MIIFELSCLADDSHRRHFINKSYCPVCDGDYRELLACKCDQDFVPDYAAYHAACADDKPIQAMESIYEYIAYAAINGPKIEIWTVRCESTRDITLDWIVKNFYWNSVNRKYLSECLKMRPIGDERPAEQLFEGWLNEYMAYPKLNEMETGVVYRRNDLPEMVFSANPDVIAMFRRHNIFVFDCNQSN